MRTAVLAALFVLVAAASSFAADPSAKPQPKAGKPGASPAASATPAAKPKEPEKGECTGTTKDGTSYRATASDYQACLREVTGSVKSNFCKDGLMQVEFTFHRGGQKPILSTAVCN